MNDTPNIDTDALKVLATNALAQKSDVVTISPETLAALLRTHEHLDSELAEVSVLADSRAEEIDALKDALRDLEDENQRLADACEGIEHAGRQ